MTKSIRAFLAAGLLVALAAGLAGPARADGIDCRQSVVYDASTSGSTKLITGQSTNQVHICGFNLWAAGIATVKLVTGTGTACATSETAITPAYSLTAQTGVTDSSPYYRGLLAAQGLDVCIKTSAGVAVQMQLFYVQK